MGIFSMICFIPRSRSQALVLTVVEDALDHVNISLCYTWRKINAQKCIQQFTFS